MFLKDYVGKNGVMSIDKFISLPEEKAIKYDFLKQGDEPDRSKLAKELYRKIFPWYESDTHGGDTLNTYRTAIRQFYGNYYRFLDREKQIEILQIIKKYTLHDENQIFEFENTDKDGNVFFQLCNNYQLGNFGIFPTRDGINPKRAKAPYLDYFNDFLMVLYEYYSDDLIADDKLKQAIFAQSEYFDNFLGFFEYIDKNLLWDYLILEDEDTYLLLGLSASKTFEEYVSHVTEIVEKRGKTIFRLLKSSSKDSLEIDMLVSDNDVDNV